MKPVRISNKESLFARGPKVEDSLDAEFGPTPRFKGRWTERGSVILPMVLVIALSSWIFAKYQTQVDSSYEIQRVTLPENAGNEGAQ